MVTLTANLPTDPAMAQEAANATMKMVTLAKEIALMSDADKAVYDAALASSTLYQLLEKGSTFLTQIAHMAEETKEPKYYAVAAQIMHQQRAIADTLLKIHADKQNIENNANGSTHDTRKEKNITNGDVMTLFRPKKD